MQETLATFIKWNNEHVDTNRSSGAVCHQDPRWGYLLYVIYVLNEIQNIRKKNIYHHWGFKSNIIVKAGLSLFCVLLCCMLGAEYVKSRPLLSLTRGQMTSPSGRWGNTAVDLEFNYFIHFFFKYFTVLFCEGLQKKILLRHSQHYFWIYCLCYFLCLMSGVYISQGVAPHRLQTHGL